MFSLKQIHYALALEKHRHFKKAAELCNVSQSALSTAISELEKQLKVQIFERNNKKVLVTPVGIQILNKFQKIQIDIDELYQFSRAKKSLLNYSLKLGVIPTIGPYLLPKVLPEVRKQYPDFKLILEEGQSQVLIDKVRNGELDTAIIALPYNTEGLHAFTFYQEEFYIAAHKNHPLIQQQEISSKELEKEPLLLLADGHCLKDHALSVCNFQRTDISSTFAGTSLYTLIQMVSAQMGITFVPEMGLNYLLHENSELRVAHLNEPGPHRKIAFITRLNYAGVNDIELLIKIFKHQLEPK